MFLENKCGDCKWLDKRDNNEHFGRCKGDCPIYVNGSGTWPEIKSTERACRNFVNAKAIQVKVLKDDDNSKDAGLRGEIKEDKKQRGRPKVLANDKKSDKE